MGRDPVVVIGTVVPFTTGGRYPGKLLFSRSQEVNVFVGVGDGLPTALPHASHRLKILMAPHWSCRVSTSGRVAGGRVSRENSCSREIWGKSAGGLGEVRNED